MSSKRTVLLVSPLPPPSGGVATWTRTLVTRGLPSPWSVDLVDTRTHALVFGALWTRLSLREVSRTARILGSFTRSIRRSPDVVHFNIASAGAGLQRDLLMVSECRRRGIRYVLHYRGDYSGLADLRGLPLYRFRRAAENASVNLVLDLVTRDALTTFLRGRSRVRQVPNYFDERMLQPRGPWPATPTVAFAGALTRAKGAHRVVDVARALPHVRFVLAGRRYPETAADLASAPGNVTLLGEVDAARVHQMMREASLFLFPTEHDEGFPNAVCEAMANGLPVVAGRRGAIPEMVEAEGGYVLDDLGTSSLTEAIRSILETPGRAEAMGAFNANKAMTQYTYPAVVGALLSEYERAIGVVKAAPLGGDR